MPNTSATGGYLSPNAAPAPAQGQALLRVLQPWIAALTGLDGTLVRPSWQGEPPPMPPANPAWNPASQLPASNCWCAVSVPRRTGDAYPATVHDDANGVDHLYRNEMLEALASFYDVGYDGLADEMADRFRDGAAISQNREALNLLGYFLVEVPTEALVVPVLKSERWVYRVDVPFRVRRTNARDYPVLSLAKAIITVQCIDPNGRAVPVSVTVNQP